MHDVESPPLPGGSIGSRTSFHRAGCRNNVDTCDHPGYFRKELHLLGKNAGDEMDGMVPGQDGEKMIHKLAARVRNSRIREKR